MDAEYSALMQNHTWKLVPLPEGREAIESRWVFRAKYNADGSLQKYKARLVAQDFSQRPGFDFTETYILHGDVAEYVYMKQPRGYEVGDGSLVCKLTKALYGLKFRHNSVVFVLVYVDDILITGNFDKVVSQVIQQLNNQFALKDMGELHYFLSIQVTKTVAGGLILSQEKYVKNILKKAEIENCKPCQTPLPFSVVGSLQYLTITRPELAYDVGKVSQFMQTPLDEHWKLVKRMLMYVSGTASFGLHLHKTTVHNIRAYIDSDWGGDPDDRKSTGGFCVFLGDNLISWSSKK
ncbi:uncharacterized protein LOC107615982 [Arachis ipaensis]|uniref:uncharacterized protein LOC107615982 n=1 Tax=Arachis ipaensis TaxID=130454 RepID=UPI0007AFBA00|nr:uncharacterized protein LOC107615982 [Arachis ipaensis]XP_025678948.1 uncharacterized protein LOC112778889 [Arachis hypogaea]